MSKTTYKKAVKKGFTGTIEEYAKDLAGMNSHWARSKKRINGAFVFYEECQDCGTREKPHYQKGLCVSCYEKTRRAYKLKKYYEYADSNRKNKISSRKKKLRHS